MKERISQYTVVALDTVIFIYHFEKNKSYFKLTKEIFSRFDKNKDFSAITSILTFIFGGNVMKLKVIIHEAEEGGYWADVPSITGCATQGETFEELLSNLYEAIEACLSVDVKDVQLTAKDKVLEIAV